MPITPTRPLIAGMLIALSITCLPAITFGQAKQRSVTFTFCPPGDAGKGGEVVCWLSLGGEKQKVTLGSHEKDVSVSVLLPKEKSENLVATLTYTEILDKPSADAVLAAASYDTVEFPIEPITGSEVRVQYSSVTTTSRGGLLREQEVKATDFVQTGIEWNKRLAMEVVKEIPVGSKANPNVGVVKIGVEHTMKRTYTVSEEFAIEGEVKANWAIVEAGIKSGIKLSTSSAVETSITEKQSVEVDGNKHPQALVLVVEHYRSGKAVVVINGKHKETIPFEFRDGIHFESTSAK